jgi:hypothetical protein
MDTNIWLSVATALSGEASGYHLPTHMSRNRCHEGAASPYSLASEAR